MNILLVNDYYPPRKVGGAEIAVAALAGALVQAGHAVTVLTGSDGQSQHGEQVISTGLEAHWGSPTDPKRGVARRAQRLLNASPVGAAALERVAKDLTPDIVHTHNIRLFGLGAWAWFRKQGWPTVHTAHDYFLVCPFRGMFKAGQPCATPCTECAAYHWRRGSRLAALNGLITASRHVMLTHEAAIPALAHLPARAVIPNGIEPPTARIPLERPWAGALTVGYLGRLVRRKGAHAVVEAARQLGDAPVRFLIAGRGEAADEAALKAQAPGNVSFLGHVRRDDFFRQLDLLVMPAEWHEPFGLVVGEAQLAGLPVIVSRRGALPEMIRPGETGAVLADGPIARCLADVLAPLAQDPAPVLAWRQALAAAPLAVADWPQIAGQTVAFYRSVASARSRL